MECLGSAVAVCAGTTSASRSSSTVVEVNLLDE